MECENEEENAWTRQIWYSQSAKVSLLQSRIEDVQLLSQPKMWEQIKSTMDQHWIRNRSTVDQQCQWINDPSTIIYKVSRTKELYYLQYYVECENGDETAWTRQNLAETVRITFNTVKYCGLLSIFSTEYVGTGFINDGSTMLHPLAARDERSTVLFETWCFFGKPNSFKFVTIGLWSDLMKLEHLFLENLFKISKLTPQKQKMKHGVLTTAPCGLRALRGVLETALRALCSVLQIWYLTGVTI